MASKLTFLLLAVSINSLVNSSSTFNTSEGIAKCEQKFDYESYFLNCTDLDGNIEITSGAFKFNVECKKSAKINFIILPKVNLEWIHFVKFENCVEENIDFGLILAHFGVNETVIGFTLEKMTFSLRPSMFSNGFGNLVGLYLQSNVIRTLDENVFQTLGKVRELALIDSGITDLPRNIFAHLSNLLKLSLSNNKLKLLEDGLFTYQNQLSFLSLNLNEILNLPKNIFANLTNLGELTLSNNKLQLLEEGIFTHQKELKHLALQHNEISELPKNIFSNLTNLRKLFLSHNIIKLLEEGLFRNQKKLTELDLSDNKISNLPKNIFANLTNLVELYLSNNKIKCLNEGLFTHQELIYLDLSYNEMSQLPRDIFANLTNLKTLWLSNNELTNLDDGLFNGINSLAELHLSYNNLTIITGLIFQELHNAHTIFLDHNHINSIDSNAFTSTVILNTLHLSYNQLQFLDKNMQLDALTVFNLSHNYLTTFPSSWEGMKSLRVLDLSFNNISSLKYGDTQIKDTKFYCNKLSQSQLDKFLKIVQDISFDLHCNSLHVFLNNNTLNCDCIMRRFLSVLSKREINELMISEICEDETIDSTSIACPVPVFGCYCKENYQNNIEIHCRDSLQQLAFQTMKHTTKKSFELYIHYNSLTELPNLESYERVILIQASHNDITHIKLENVPQNLRFLDVSYNKIQTISADVINALHNYNKLEAFLISHNPWVCDCSANTEKFIELLKSNNLLTDRLQTACMSSIGLNKELSIEVWKEICGREEKKIIVLILLITIVPLIIIGFLVIWLAIFIYKHKKHIRIWLYAHNICLCCIGEKDFDKYKDFDAFMSYTFHDEDLAVNIVNELETGNPRFKMCTHMRDFVPGKLIQQSIAESMDNSCRTIIILSKNFLRSFWCRSEFRRAYESGLVERRMRLIIVINGDIGDHERLEPTLRTYLKTHTYIEWGDPWFWQKMHYALPHRNKND